MAARKKPAPTRRTPKEGGLYERTGTRIDPKTGRTITYQFWQATREVPPAWLPEGKTRHRITGNGATRDEARQRLEENWAKFLNAPAAGKPKRRRRQSSARSQDATMDDLFAAWDTANRAGRISDLVAHKYAQMWHNHIAEHIGSTRVRDVNPQMLDRLINVKVGAKTRTVSTVVGSKTVAKKQPVMKLSALNNVKTCLSSMFAFAISNGMCDYNPARAIRLNQPSTQNENLSELMSRADALLDKLQRDDDPDYCRWLFQFLGLRRAERLGLAWDCVEGLDTDQARIVIRRQLARKPTGGVWYLKDKTKNEQVRTVALVGPFRDALRAHKARQDELKASGDWKPDKAFADLVFLRPNGGMITLNQDNIDWHKVLDRNGFDYWRGHLNRHITATRLARIEPPIATPIIESILGHKTDALKKYYVHRAEIEQFASLAGYAQQFPSAQTAADKSR
ncbi:MAG: hypothetical protein RLZZ43_503 [Actinomycetota bacterium]|jgi:hypothetical protein